MLASRWAKFSLFCFVSAAIATAATALWFSSFLAQPVAPPQEQLILVSPGTSFTKVARELEQAGVVSDSHRFILLARWQDASAHIHAGEYLFSAPATPAEILARLVSGDVRKLQLTIPEGFTLAEIAARVENAGIGSAESFLTLAGEADWLKDLDVDADTLEGYLFPETYTYTTDSTLRELLVSMVEQFRQQLTAEILAGAEERGLNLHQLVTLASIIQKEAGNVAEMPLISAVFHNRLKLGMRLQADPTVIYGIEDFDGNLTRSHLREDTPYNTYRRMGLPPGPIASPGLEALYAAAFPADADYLYFVSKGDGSHVFNLTLQEHNRAVRRYQLLR